MPNYVVYLCSVGLRMPLWALRNYALNCVQHIIISIWPPACETTFQTAILPQAITPFHVCLASKYTKDNTDAHHHTKENLPWGDIYIAYSTQCMQVPERYHDDGNGEGVALVIICTSAIGDIYMVFGWMKWPQAWKWLFGNYIYVTLWGLYSTTIQRFAQTITASFQTISCM